MDVREEGNIRTVFVFFSAVGYRNKAAAKKKELRNTEYRTDKAMLDN